MAELKGLRAFITGAGRGIGRAIALVFAQHGAELVLVSRTKAQLASVADECVAAGSPNVVVRAADVGNGAELDTLIQETLAQGPIDVLVNNAGIVDEENIEKMFAVNLTAPIKLQKAFTPSMTSRGKGVVINIGSIAAVEAMTNSPGYAASKHGLRGWSLSSYLTLRHKNIKVVLINPAFVNTDLVASSPNVIPERMLTPEDIAEAAMLAFRTSSACVPQEITLRLTLSAYKS